MYATAWFKQYDDHFHFSSFSVRAWMSHGCVVVAHLERCVSTRIWSKLNNIYRLPFFLSAMCNRTKYFAHVCFIGSSIEAVDLIFLSIFPNSRPNSPVTFFMPDAGFWDYSIVFFLPKPFLDIIFSLTLFFTLWLLLQVLYMASRQYSVSSLWQKGFCCIFRRVHVFECTETATWFRLETACRTLLLSHFIAMQRRVLLGVWFNFV